LDDRRRAVFVETPVVDVAADPFQYQSQRIYAARMTARAAVERARLVLARPIGLTPVKRMMSRCTHSY
jgi:hypothetical protein